MDFFWNVKQLTIIPIVFENRNEAQSFFVIESNSIQYKVCDRNHFYCLTKGALLKTLKYLAQVETKTYSSGPENL